jgi:aryl-alcohol dehydrogenase-like predicted oxidoreductase
VALEVADSSGRPVTPQEVALAWLSASGPTVVPIPGFSRSATAATSAGAADIELTAAQVARLDASRVGPVGSVFPDDED